MFSFPVCHSGAHLLEAQHLLLEALNCPSDLRGFSPKGSPPSQCQAETVVEVSAQPAAGPRIGLLLLLLLPRGIMMQAGSVLPDVTCPRPCWADIWPVQVPKHGVPKVPAFVCYTHVFCCCFLSMGVTSRFASLWELLVQDTHERNGPKPQVGTY